MQSLQIDRVVLVLSALEFPGREADIPARLRRLVGHSDGRIIVHFTADNKRSFKKLLPILEMHPEATVITVDDDVLYWRSWAYTLDTASRSFPGTVIGTRGTRIRAAGGDAQPYVSWPSCVQGTADHSTFLTGRGGILYPPYSLDPRVHDWEKASELCPAADDIWFKAMATLADVKAVKINTGREYPSNGASQNGALWTQNVSRSENDAAFKRVMDHFGLWSKYDESN